MRRSRLRASWSWYLSPAADAAIDAAIAADHRRSWDPRRETVSLSTLSGKAKRYGGRYMRSREELLWAADVEVRELYASPAGRRVWVVTMPGEPLSAAVRIGRDSEGRRELREVGD